MQLSEHHLQNMTNSDRACILLRPYIIGFHYYNSASFIIYIVIIRVSSFTRFVKDIDVCEILFSKQEKVLTDLNLRRVKILDMAFDACINLERWNEAMMYGSKLLPGFRLVLFYNFLSICKTQQLLRIAKVFHWSF